VSELDKHDWYNPARIPVIIAPTLQPQPIIDEHSIENMLSQKIRVIQDNVKKEEEEKRKSMDESRWIEEEKKKLDQEDAERKEKVQHQFRQAAIEMANKIKVQNKKIDDCVKLFRENYSRNPLKEELQESLNGQVDDEILEKYFNKHAPNGDDKV
jgi:DNA polymerase II small subunit/DNA polymerase delta subunit B